MTLQDASVGVEWAGCRCVIGALPLTGEAPRAGLPGGADPPRLAKGSIHRTSGASGTCGADTRVGCDRVSPRAAAGVDAGHVWWHWIVGVLILWLSAGLALGLLIGRAIRFADRPSSGAGVGVTTADPRHVFAAPLPRGAARRRAVPLPPVGIALAATAVALETTGFILRLTGATGPTAVLFSMDAPLGLPRMYVSLLFAGAAVAAVVAGGRMPGRRSWWLAVALVGGTIASVKASGNLHADVMSAAGNALGGTAAVLLSALAAVAVMGLLWLFTRSERRDRRRVLGSLGFYAVASVGLSAVSAAVPGGWAAAATFVEESGEALAAVAFLMAVLVGVAPRAVLPVEWRLQREADVHALGHLAEKPGRPLLQDPRV